MRAWSVRASIVRSPEGSEVEKVGEGWRRLEKVGERLEKVGEGWRRSLDSMTKYEQARTSTTLLLFLILREGSRKFEKARQGWRRLEKVGEDLIKLYNFRNKNGESLRKFEKVRES